MFHVLCSMIIGIDASRAFKRQRTGIEEYSYQIIKNLVNEIREHEVVLYLRSSQKTDFNLPDNWKIKIIKWPRFWTQVGLSLEMFLRPVDALFIPAHTVPFIHPARTVVTIHGLEYEFCPEAYSFWEKIYMRFSIKNSCKWAKKIIAVSENTKKDLIKFYNVPEEKIRVVYEGCSIYYPELVLGSNGNEMLKRVQHDKYLLFIGRLEERKNTIGIVKAFNILKSKYKILHKLVLAGKPGFGYEKIKNKLAQSRRKDAIIELGFISEEEKQYLLKNAEVFLFPSFYEGFGLPILEAQNAGVPVVTSNVSSIPEVVSDSALLVDPNNAKEIADAVYKIISNENIKKDLVQKGLENVKRFSWSKCAREIAEVLGKKH